MKTFTISFNNCPTFKVSTLRDEKAAIKTAITSAKYYLKVECDINVSIAEQRKNLISINQLY